MLPNPQETMDLISFTGEILNEKLYFFCSETYLLQQPLLTLLITLTYCFNFEEKS